jgi:hypothetical protein
LPWGSEAVPPEARFRVVEASAPVRCGAFVILRWLVDLQVTSNRESTLVTVTPGLPPDQLPELSLRSSAAPVIYAGLLPGGGHLQVRPGVHSVRCWSYDLQGRPQAADPPGGTLVMMVSGETYPFACRFPENP